MEKVKDCKMIFKKLLRGSVIIGISLLLQQYGEEISGCPDIFFE
jgi:hypothetical protein